MRAIICFISFFISNKIGKKRKPILELNSTLLVYNETNSVLSNPYEFSISSSSRKPVTGHFNRRRVLCPRPEHTTINNFWQLFTAFESMTYLIGWEIAHSPEPNPWVSLPAATPLQMPDSDWQSSSGIPRWDFCRKKIKDISTHRVLPSCLRHAHLHSGKQCVRAQVIPRLPAKSCPVRPSSPLPSP